MFGSNKFGAAPFGAEAQSTTVAPPFISSVTVVFAPTLNGGATSVTVTATFGAPAFGWAYFGEGAPGSRPAPQDASLPFIGSGAVVYTPQLLEAIALPFIASATVVYAPALVSSFAPPFIGSTTTLYSILVEHAEVDLPFIPSSTVVYGVWSVFNPDWTGVGPGNGGETFPIRLAPNGANETATLAVGIGPDDLLVQLTGDGGFPTSEPFVATIGGEVLYLFPLGGGAYSVRKRAMSNTTASAHSAGATVTWGDSYDLAIASTENINASFTANINSTGSSIYYGWLICIDSSQAYLAGSRYPVHVTEVLGVFAAGAGATGTNRCDGSQPNAIATPTGVSDDCPAALSNPALITSDIVPGDVGIVRYTNPEGVALDLGPRSTALQSWYGLKRVDATDHDVTVTDPDGYVVDTIPSGPGPGPFTGSVNGEWPDPVPEVIGIAPDASDLEGFAVPTPNPVPWTTVTLPGADRHFTYGPPGYSEKGWPMCCLAVRQGNRRVPHWQSWDWHNYGYVYTGFGPDDTFCQLLINRNGLDFHSVPTVELPGPQNIDGPDAVWDDGTYYFGASWYVVLFNAPYIVSGPSIGGGSSSLLPGSPTVPIVGFPGGGGGGPVFTLPSPPPVAIEGGSGGDITPPTPGVLAWQQAAGPAR